MKKDRTVTFALGEGVRLRSTLNSDREWRMKRTPSGWRLAFRDRGDETWTNAGLFREREAAERQAARG